MEQSEGISCRLVWRTNSLRCEIQSVRLMSFEDIKPSSWRGPADRCTPPPPSPASESQMTPWRPGIIYARRSHFPTSSEVVTPWVLTDLWCRHQRGNDPKSHLEFLRWPSFMGFIRLRRVFYTNSIITAGGPAGAFRRLKKCGCQNVQSDEDTI